MFDLIPPGHAALQEYLWSHSEGLQNAALVLGGMPAVKATNVLIDDVCSSTVLSRRVMQNLSRLHELLSLEHVHDPDRPEAAYFTALDPAAPYVEDICLMADQLRGHMEKLEAPLRLPQAA
ncbi:hypothetical protein JQV19_06105 [Sulfitobacter mediterraneus]|uniref:hypothetical protein n=1 Tax=Sulfitobacter mediterraneus TaxID=83219 RepID=UPI00193A6C10|nr:hypothetical protein [Sulfitobacter mediterraneus]MBM1556221.1 hypothetical protein [Sulfitobacter mediterraneus]MBM1567741.1 hypothetical protein [Sulfitobacter mediterraneus]MBM1571575.1 hypothetical protein [Sulfitobacter mediterraneus]MBM1575363.1 hypothetical protein [Sulfitobacter mediterraneus]MBM1579146.1 hypothetical protein [Sulfitobacter mediterraneus]